MLEPRNDPGELPRVAASTATGITVWSSPAEGSQSGGDWCEIVEISPEVTALTIGDVAGHGDSVAEVMLAVRGSVLHALRFMRDPSDVLAAANAFIANRADEPIVTAIVAFFDRARRTLTYANAGHPSPLLVRRDSASFLTPARADIPLGVYARHCAQIFSLALPPQALAVFYTDGVTERDRDPIRGERELADAAVLALSLSDGDYARTIAESVFAMGRGDDDAVVMVLDTAGAAIRHERARSASGQGDVRVRPLIERYRDTQF